MPTIIVDIPEDLAANFDNPEAIRSYGEFVELLGSKGLSPINVVLEDVEESYRRFVEFMDQR